MSDQAHRRRLYVRYYTETERISGGLISIPCSFSFGSSGRSGSSSRVLTNQRNRMRYAHAVFAALLPLSLSVGAQAQSAAPVGPGLDGPRTTGAITEIQPNTTGNDADLVIAPGATGAETITTDSAAGGNANLPERPVPNGSAGGGSSGQGGG
jgi:hypothetical protein